MPSKAVFFFKLQFAIPALPEECWGCVGGGGGQEALESPQMAVSYRGDGCRCGPGQVWNHR